MAIAPVAFWDMTPREFSNACEGYNKRIERDYQNSWEQARWVATVIVNINSPKKRYKPQDIATFPWEKEGEGGIEEGIKELKERRKWREQGQH